MAFEPRAENFLLKIIMRSDGSEDREGSSEFLLYFSFKGRSIFKARIPSTSAFYGDLW